MPRNRASCCCKMTGMRSLSLEGAKLPSSWPHGNDSLAILGNYLGQVCPDEFGSTSCVTTIFDAVKEHAGDVALARRCDVNSTDDSGMHDAIAAADAADAVIYVGGLDGTVEREGKIAKTLASRGFNPSCCEDLRWKAPRGHRTLSRGHRDHGGGHPLAVPCHHKRWISWFLWRGGHSRLRL